MRWADHQKGIISAVNGRKRALLTKSALEWHNKRGTAQSMLCVDNKKGKTKLKANFFFLVKRAGCHLSFLKMAGRHQKGAGRRALQKRPRQNTDSTLPTASDGFWRRCARFKKWIGYDCSWQSEHTHNVQLITWAVLVDGIGHHKPFAGFLPGVSSHAQRIVNKWLSCITHAFPSFLLHVSSIERLILR